MISRKKWSEDYDKDVKSVERGGVKEGHMLTKDDILDPYIKRAYTALDRGDPEKWHSWDNCKHHARKLFNLALELYKKDIKTDYNGLTLIGKTYRD